jgi:F0F1-type ATP synthase alpha subunit
LETELFYKGIRPAINVGLSVSRVGSAAQIKAMKQVAGSLNSNMRSIEKSLPSLNSVLILTLPLKDSLTEEHNLLNSLNKNNMSMPAEEHIVVYSGVRGYLDKMVTSEISKFERLFLDYVKI